MASNNASIFSRETYKSLRNEIPHLSCMVNTGVIQLVFYGLEEGSALKVGIQCVSCGELIEWVEDEGWWECPECKFEVTPTESLFLGKLAIKALKIMNKDSKKKGGKVTWRMLKGKGRK